MAPQCSLCHYVGVQHYFIFLTKSDFFFPTLTDFAAINTETVQAANFKIDHYSGSLHTGKYERHL